jgi:hypothetical protein
VNKKMDISQRTLRHSTSRLLVLPARSRHNGKKVQQMSLGSVVPFVETPYGNLTARDNGGSKRFSVVSMFSGYLR